MVSVPLENVVDQRPCQDSKPPLRCSLAFDQPTGQRPNASPIKPGCIVNLIQPPPTILVKLIETHCITNLTLTRLTWNTLTSIALAVANLLINNVNCCSVR